MHTCFAHLPCCPLSGWPADPPTWLRRLSQASINTEGTAKLYPILFLHTTQSVTTPWTSRSATSPSFSSSPARPVWCPPLLSSGPSRSTMVTPFEVRTARCYVTARWMLTSSTHSFTRNLMRREREERNDEQKICECHANSDHSGRRLTARSPRCQHAPAARRFSELSHESNVIATHGHFVHAMRLPYFLHRIAVYESGR